MSISIHDIIRYGAQDVNLSGSNEITFWKVVYRRHTNFMMESIHHDNCFNTKLKNRNYINFKILNKPLSDAKNDEYYSTKNVLLINLSINNRGLIFRYIDDNLSYSKWSKFEKEKLTNNK